MKYSLFKVLLCIFLLLQASGVADARSPRPDQVKPSNQAAVATRIDAIKAINATVSWWEDYRIEINTSFWGKLWLRIKKFFIYLTVDQSYLANISKSKLSDDIFLANKWGMELSDSTAKQPITGWELLELESQALSKALSYCGVYRSLTDEVSEIRQELEKLSKSMNLNYQNIIKARIIAKPLRVFKPDNAWVYYIFATQHGLLPDSDVKSTPSQLLNTKLTKMQIDLYIAKLKELLGQMAIDLN